MTFAVLAGARRARADQPGLALRPVRAVLGAARRRSPTCTWAGSRASCGSGPNWEFHAVRAHDRRAVPARRWSCPGIFFTMLAAVAVPRGARHARPRRCTTTPSVPGRRRVRAAIGAAGITLFVRADARRQQRRAREVPAGRGRPPQRWLHGARCSSLPVGDRGLSPGGSAATSASADLHADRPPDAARVPAERRRAASTEASPTATARRPARGRVARGATMRRTRRVIASVAARDPARAPCSVVVRDAPRRDRAGRGASSTCGRRSSVAAIVVAAIVYGLIAWSLIRYRRRRRDATTTRASSSTRTCRSRSSTRRSRSRSCGPVRALVGTEDRALVGRAPTPT